MSIETWNQRYSGSGDAAGSEPAALVTKFASVETLGRRALDLACGAGRNALWLAGQGWQVTAVDGSEVAIQLVERRAQTAGVAIETQVVDLEADQYRIEPAAWDLIVIYNYLQHNLFPALQTGVKPGGLAIVSVHLAEPDRASRFSVQSGELQQIFARWDILHSHEGSPTGLSGGRPVAEIVARKAT